MYNFKELIKKIRQASGLSQKDFAKVLEVSTVLITMIETGQKNVSKALIKKLADKLEVNPTAITPFIFFEDNKNQKLNFLEKKLIQVGEKLQEDLIKRKASNLKKHLE